MSSRPTVAIGLMYLLLVLGLPGCGSSQPDGPAAPGFAGGGETKIASDDWSVPSDEECQAFAAAVEELVIAGDVAGFNKAFDWDVLIERATAGVEASDASRDGFRDGVIGSIVRQGGLCTQIVKEIQNGGTYELLRVGTAGDRMFARFRLVGEGGLNYHDMLLKKCPDGEVRAVDMHVFLAGESISDTLRRGFVQAVAAESRGLVAKLTGQDNEYVENLPKLQAMGEALRQGKAERTLQLYRELPESLQNDKSMLLMRYNAASQLGGDEIIAAVDAFRKAHPKDACIDMVAIDGHLAKEEYGEALACVDRVDEVVGGDPYLSVIRAGIHNDQGDLDKARQLAEEAIAADASIEDAYWTLVTVSLAKKDFDETARLLTLIEGELGVELNDVGDVPEYAEFAESPQYEMWLTSRK